MFTNSLADRGPRRSCGYASVGDVLSARYANASAVVDANLFAFWLANDVKRLGGIGSSPPAVESRDRTRRKSLFGGLAVCQRFSIIARETIYRQMVPGLFGGGRAV